MLMIDCPYCGERPELEFVNAGEAHILRSKEMDALTDKEIAQFLFFRKNPKGVHAERWRHVHGCAKFFNALRDTRNDKFLATYKIGTPSPVESAKTGSSA